MAFLKRKIVLVLSALCLLGVACVVVLTVLTLHSSLPSVDCGERRPFAVRLHPGQAVFVAKILYVSADWQPSDEHMPWSIALVEHRYWGLPWWVPNLVLIGHGRGFFKEGAEYCTDGDRPGYRVPSSYVGDFDCGNRTRLLSQAGLETRLLNDGPPRTGVRIIGRTYRLSSEGKHHLHGGVKVEITGPESTVFSISDQDGIYDAVGLPPGHYSIRADSADDADTDSREHYERSEGELKAGDVWGRDVFVK